MRLVRFMGIEEMRKYLDGETLNNYMPWGIVGKSTSVGFCFFPADPAPETRLHYVSGVVDFAVVAEFETIGPVMLRKGTGKYRDPDGDPVKDMLDAIHMQTKMMEVEEYSMKSYSRSSLRLVRMGTVVLCGHFEWKILWGKGPEDGETITDGHGAVLRDGKQDGLLAEG